MLSGLSTLFFFILALAILIAFHEFGHFYAARKLGVHVIRFSIGFGKPLFKIRDKKGTEFALSWIPLGGYVKMLGESLDEKVPDSLKSQAFQQKSVWARMIIIIAGPAFNILLAIIALWGMYLIGTTSLAPIIGSVEPNSIAAKAQLENMDEIVQVNHTPVTNWQHIQIALASAIGEELPLNLQLYNIKTHAHHSANISLTDWTLEKDDKNLIKKLGITPAMPPISPIVSKVYANHPGATAGLQIGDRVTQVNNKKIHDWIELVSIIQKSPDKKIELTISRNNTTQTLFIYPQAKKIRGETYGFIGVEAEPPADLKTVWLKTERYSFFNALLAGIQETGRLTQISFKLIGKLLTGAFSFHTISGPIGMAQWAGQAAELGWAHYLSFLALVSISLGVLNILPIPMLDGGHLLYCVFEVILRRPLSEKIRLLGMRLGFSLLVALMFLAVFNDLSRFNLS